MRGKNDMGKRVPPSLGESVEIVRLAERGYRLVTSGGLNRADQPVEPHGARLNALAFEFGHQPIGGIK